MTITITKELLSALCIKSDRRKTLRTLASPILATLDEQKLVDAAMANPRVQAGQLKPRANLTGVRDQMTITALTSLIMGLQDPSATMIALMADANDTEFGFAFDASSNVAVYLKAFMDACYAHNKQEILSHVGSLGANAGQSIPLPDNWESIVDAAGKLGDDDDEEDDAPAKGQAAAPAVEIKFDGMTAQARSMINSLLSSLSVASIDTIESELKRLSAENKAAKSGPKGMNISYNFVGQPNLAGNAGVPSGSLVMKRAYDVFDVGNAKNIFDFDVPTFDWSAPHPEVPALDPDYQFQPEQLMRVLWAIVTNQKAWLYGHTGTGKSSLIEQVCARLNYPMVRVNFDSEITRMDLIGRDVLANAGGTVTTRFEDGILPRALQMPCILLCDEMDFIRPDVAYVMQRALENKGLLITEDGGRLIQPDPMCRIIATANTKGGGDDTGRYMGARPQSGAFLDRFTCWVEVDYMTPSAVSKLIEAKVPNIDKDGLKILRDYAKEHWTGFRQGDILQPLSPRGLISAGNAYTFFKGLMPVAEAMERAIRATISDRCSDTDAQTINGLVQRVSK